jgi:hypothetical protein
MNLQNQIRQKFVDGIINGAFAPGMKLPSSRKLSQQLDIARNLPNWRRDPYPFSYDLHDLARYYLAHRELMSHGRTDA